MLSKLVFVTSLTLSLVSASVCYAKPKEKAKSYHTCTKNDNTEKVLACTLYAEARGEGVTGMYMVGNVVINRKSHDRYPSKIKKVIFQPHQFSYLKEKPLKIYEKDSWQQAQQVAKTLIFLDKNKYLKNHFTDPTKGSIMYLKKGTKTYWTKDYIKVVSYKQHVFYKEG